MTAIAGLIHGKDVYIGGDSAGVEAESLSITVRADQKVFNKGPFIMGFTSSFRMGQLLRYKLVVPVQKKKQDDMEYMVTSFIDNCRTCFTKNGYGTVSVGGNFLVGYKGKLYNIQSDFQVGLPKVDFDAAGCGSDLVLGSLYSTPEMAPEKRITTALEAASTFSAGVTGPFTIVKLKK